MGARGFSDVKEGVGETEPTGVGFSWGIGLLRGRRCGLVGHDLFESDVTEEKSVYVLIEKEN